MKIGGVEFKEIDLTQVHDYAQAEVVPNPNNDPRIKLLSRRLAAIYMIKQDMKFHEEMVKKGIYIDDEENKKKHKAFIARSKNKIRKQMRASQKLMKEMGWIKNGKV